MVFTFSQGKSDINSPEWLRLYIPWSEEILTWGSPSNCSWATSAPGISRRSHILVAYWAGGITATSTHLGLQKLKEGCTQRPRKWGWCWGPKKRNRQEKSWEEPKYVSPIALLCVCVCLCVCDAYTHRKTSSLNLKYDFGSQGQVP